MSELVPIKAYASRHEADLARAVLEANGIAAVVSGDDAGSMRPGLGSLQRIRLLVPASCAADALALLVEPDSSA